MDGLFGPTNLLLSRRMLIQVRQQDTVDDKGKVRQDPKVYRSWIEEGDMVLGYSPRCLLARSRHTMACI